MAKFLHFRALCNHRFPKDGTQKPRVFLCGSEKLTDFTAFPRWLPSCHHSGHVQSVPTTERKSPAREQAGPCGRLPLSPLPPGERGGVRRPARFQAQRPDTLDTPGGEQRAPPRWRPAFHSQNRTLAIGAARGSQWRLATMARTSLCFRPREGFTDEQVKVVKLTCSPEGARVGATSLQGQEGAHPPPCSPRPAPTASLPGRPAQPSPALRCELCAVSSALRNPALAFPSEV